MGHRPVLSLSCNPRVRDPIAALAEYWHLTGHSRRRRLDVTAALAAGWGRPPWERARERVRRPRRARCRLASALGVPLGAEGSAIPAGPSAQAAARESSSSR